MSGGGTRGGGVGLGVGEVGDAALLPKPVSPVQHTEQEVLHAHDRRRGQHLEELDVEVTLEEREAEAAIEDPSEGPGGEGDIFDQAGDVAPLEPERQNRPPAKRTPIPEAPPRDATKPSIDRGGRFPGMTCAASMAFSMSCLHDGQ